MDLYAAGKCANLSQRGIFVLAAKCPPLGAKVEIEFVLPAVGLVTQPVRMNCVGRVSRIESCYQQTGFAVAGEFASQTLLQPAIRLATQ